MALSGTALAVEPDGSVQVALTVGVVAAATPAVTVAVGIATPLKFSATVVPTGAPVSVSVITIGAPAALQIVPAVPHVRVMEVGLIAPAVTAGVPPVALAAVNAAPAVVRSMMDGETNDVPVGIVTVQVVVVPPAGTVQVFVVPGGAWASTTPANWVAPRNATATNTRPRMPSLLVPFNLSSCTYRCVCAYARARDCSRPPRKAAGRTSAAASHRPAGAAAPYASLLGALGSGRARLRPGRGVAGARRGQSVCPVHLLQTGSGAKG